MTLIEDYALIGDTQTAALVGRDGSIDWLCVPRFDSAACFAAVLGDVENGHWQIAPVDGRASTRRRYRGDTLILETTWESTAGTVRLIDFMPPRDVAVDIVRIVEGVSGSIDMRSVLRLRFDYGHLIPWVHKVDHQIAAVAGPDSVYLRSDVPMHGEDFSTVGDFRVDAGDRVRFVLTWHPSHQQAPRPVHPDVQLHKTQLFWDEWIDPCTPADNCIEPVTRSLITLKALTYSPTGGIVAAPTTSLPEDIGGVRNWDYRYCWLRDASLTLEAMLQAGFTHEAASWKDWLVRAIAGSPQDVQVLYGVAGERRLLEYEIDWLAGYEKSQPVRVGNAAVSQLQLDVWGQVMDALWIARERGVEGSPAAWDLQQALVDHLETIWNEPDEGIWEVRGPRQHFTHSKVMAWVAFDRAARTVERQGRKGDGRRWRAAADKIHHEVCTRGWDERRSAFTQAYGSDALDAALLLLPRVGFLPGSDPRVVSTVDAVERELAEDGLVHRYQTPGSAEHSVDGLPGREGAFIACSFWLASALHLTGRPERARETFDRVLDLRNDVGLLAEEYDVGRGRQLGNFPQAFSHVGLVNAAHLLSGRPTRVN
jgi:GH15 family glucan-1,4-alpha-glucosidase